MFAVIEPIGLLSDEDYRKDAHYSRKSALIIEQIKKYKPLTIILKKKSSNISVEIRGILARLRQSSDIYDKKSTLY
jgi:predicted glycosyltransferase